MLTLIRHLLLVGTAISVAARCIESTDWTYQNVFDYVNSKGVSGHSIARAIADHVSETSGVEWNDIYRGDINIAGAVMTVEHTPHARLMKAKKELRNSNAQCDQDSLILQKRQLLPGASLTAYLCVEDCR